MTLTPGQTLYIAALAYERGDGTGAESKLTTARITHYEGSTSLDLVEKTRNAYQITYRATARDADFDTVRIAYRTRLVSAGPSEDYASPAPSFDPTSGYGAQPRGFDIVLDLPLSVADGGADRWLECWAEDSNGNRSGITRELIPSMLTADRDGALVSFTVGGQFSGTCPTRNMDHNIQFARGSGVPTSWRIDLYWCDTSGCNPITGGVDVSGASSPHLRTNVVSGVQAGINFTQISEYAAKIFNGYNEEVDDDRVTSSTDYNLC